MNDKYLLTATIRSDGSSKFGENNRYAYFPSVAAAWNISNEGFMKNMTFFNSLKLRAGYGQTGNQEFNPVDAALAVSTYNGYNNQGVNHFANPNLKWETVSSIDAGIDFTILNKKVWGFVDYFSKKTPDPILDFAVAEPTAGSGTIYKNMDGVQAQEGWVTNKGVEVSLGAQIVENKDFSWDVSANATFVKNKFEAPDLTNVPFVKYTGGLHGQGSSGAYAQVLAAGQPIDVFYLKEFQGFDKTTGLGIYGAQPGFAGDPNPKVFVGFSTNLNYKKWGLTINMHGSFGSLIYNNTNMSVLNVNNIVGGRNIISNLVGNGESTANAITPSTRFLESGDYMKLGNAAINYQLGNIGKFIKGATIYVNGE
jgi:iron complex outermembrane receptor protein